MSQIVVSFGYGGAEREFCSLVSISISSEKSSQVFCHPLCIAECLFHVSTPAPPEPHTVVANTASALLYFIHFFVRDSSFEIMYLFSLSVQECFAACAYVHHIHAGPTGVRKEPVEPVEPLELELGTVVSYQVSAGSPEPSSSPLCLLF